MNIRIVQKKDVVYKNGCSPLFIRFTSERKSKFISLGVSVLPEHWYNEQQRIMDDCPESNVLNASITTKLEEYRKRIRKLEVLIKPLKRKPQEATILQFRLHFNPLLSICLPLKGAIAPHREI